MIITLRLPANISSDIAGKEKDKFINNFKLNGIHFNDEIQKEFSVYDTNPTYDENWL